MLALSVACYEAFQKFSATIDRSSILHSLFLEHFHPGKALTIHVYVGNRLPCVVRVNSVSFYEVLDGSPLRAVQLS